METLNFHHLRYFWLVARDGNLTQVAERLRVSQSAVSAQIRQLEEVLGRPLFERQHRRLKLTEFGAVVMHYADEIFSVSGEMLDAIAGEGGRLRQRLRVGAVATLSRNFQEGLLRPLIGREGLHLVVASGRLEDLLEQMKRFELDLVLSNRAVAASADEAWRCRRIARQPVSLIGPPGRKRFRFPHDARGLKLLLPGRSSDVRTQVDALWEEHGLAADVTAEVDDMAMLRLLVRDGAGVAVVPQVVVKDELREKKVRVYCELPGIHENFYAITMKRRRALPLVDEVLRAAQAGGLA